MDVFNLRLAIIKYSRQSCTHVGQTNTYNMILCKFDTKFYSSQSGKLMTVIRDRTISGKIIIQQKKI